MNEFIKTILFVVAAVGVTLGAVFTYPKQEDFELPDLVGKPLFAEFTDPAKAAELHILKFREDIGKFSEFEVARDANTGLWVIPSSANYPADADAQMRDAATSLIDLKVLDVASELASEHETYGVIEPDKQMDRSQVGVGLSVTVRNSKGKDLARLIIGKRVKSTTDHHFVRKPGIDSIYVVQIDPEQFPTDFDSWIERDLLKINTLDIERVTLKDYSILKQQTLAGTRGTIKRRFQADLTWSADQNQWSLAQLFEYRNGQPQPVKLLDTEEVNGPNLNDLREALGGMKIVGVMRKPAGLGADLKAGAEITDNQENQLSLNSRGFYLVAIGGREPELRAANGELVVGLNNGVQYILRFGDIADVSEESEEGKLSRYLLVSARLDASKFPPLQLKPLPKDDSLGPDATAAEKADLELQREHIRKENQRLKDQREEQLNRARQQVAALNERFGDWYYVISEDEYKRVHLNRNNLIQESAAAVLEGFGVDAFRQLERQGLKGR